MLKGLSSHIEFGIVGLFSGAFFGGLYFVNASNLIKVGGVAAIFKAISNGVLIGSITGFILLGVILAFIYGRQGEGVQLRLKLATGGALTGIMIGTPQLKFLALNTIDIKYQYAAMTVGALVGIFIYSFLVGNILAYLNKKGKYLQYKGEIFIISFMNFFGANIGLWLYSHIAKSKHFSTSNIWVTILCSVLIPLLVCLCLSLPMGFLMGANPSRPAVGASLAITGGLLVLWVGINIAPILFMPHSGLYWSGLIIGLIICSLAVSTIVLPKLHVVFGVLIVIFSILSLIGAAGGLIIGCLLGLLGGTFIMSWDIPKSSDSDSKPMTIEANQIEQGEPNVTA